MSLGAPVLHFKILFCLQTRVSDTTECPDPDKTESVPGLTLQSVLVAQSCPTLWDRMDCSPPGPSVRGILQARTLEWMVISFSGGSSQPRD